MARPSSTSVKITEEAWKGRVVAKVGVAMLVSTAVMMTGLAPPTGRSAEAPGLIRHEAKRDGVGASSVAAVDGVAGAEAAAAAKPHKSWMRREPRQQEEAAVASTTHKSVIRREPKQEVQAAASTTRPAEWGKMMRREAPKVPPAGGAGDNGRAKVSGITGAHLGFFLVALVALVGFARQVKATITTLLRLHPSAAGGKAK